MNTKTTLTAVLLALTIGVYFLVFETNLFNRRLPSAERSAQQAGQDQETGTALFGDASFSAPDVARLRIEKRDRPAVTIDHNADEDRWTQAEPVSFELQGRKLRNIITDAAGLRYSTRFRPVNRDMSLEQLGLAPPRATLTIEGPEMETRTLHLGHQTGAGRAYLALGEPSAESLVYVVNDALHETLLDAPIRELRRKSLASIPGGRAQRIEVKHDGGTIELVKRDGRWSLGGQASGRAGADAAESLVQAVSGASISAFVADEPPDLTPFGLEDPRARFTVELLDPSDGEEDADGDSGSDESGDDSASASGDQSDGDDTSGGGGGTTTHELVIGDAEDLEGSAYFAMFDGKPTVFTVSKSVVEKLRKSPDELRDPRLTPVSRSDVKAVTLERKERGKLRMVREESAWSFGEPKPGFGLESTSMEQLLAALFDAEAGSFVSLNGKEPGEALATVDLGVVAQSEAESLSVYPHDSEATLMVVREGESTGYVVGRDQLEPLFRPALAFRSRDVLDLEESDIAAMRIVRSGRYPADYELTRQEPTDGSPDSSGDADGNSDGDSGGENQQLGPWKLEGLDTAAVRTVIDQFTPLRAERWLEEAPVTTPEGVAVHLTLANGTERRVKIHPGSRTGRAEHIESAFRVSEAVVDALTAELRETVVLELGVDQMAKVEIGELTLRRDRDGRYSLTGGELSERLAGALYDTLAGLSAEHFVDAGRAKGEPSRTLKITPREGEARTLKLWTSEGGPTVGTLGDKTFTLPDDTAETLLTDPIKSEESQQSGPGGMRQGGGQSVSPQNLPPGVQQQMMRQFQQRQQQQQQGN